MSSLRFPMSICAKIDFIVWDFWWGQRISCEKSLFKILGYDLSTQRSRVGGLGLRRIDDINRSSIVEVSWNVLQAWTYHFWRRCAFKSLNLLWIPLPCHNGQWSISNIIGDINLIAQSFPCCTFSHVLRCANTLAHSLAAWAPFCNCLDAILISTLPDLVLVLQAKMADVGCPDSLL